MLPNYFSSDSQKKKEVTVVLKNEIIYILRNSIPVDITFGFLAKKVIISIPCGNLSFREHHSDFQKFHIFLALLKHHINSNYYYIFNFLSDCRGLFPYGEIKYMIGWLWYQIGSYNKKQSPHFWRNGNFKKIAKYPKLAVRILDKHYWKEEEIYYIGIKD